MDENQSPQEEQLVETGLGSLPPNEPSNVDSVALAELAAAAERERIQRDAEDAAHARFHQGRR